MARHPATLTVRVDGARVALGVDLAAPAADAAAALLAALGFAGAPPDVLVSREFVACVCSLRRERVPRAGREGTARNASAAVPPSPQPDSPSLTFPPSHSGWNTLAPRSTRSTRWRRQA